MNLHDILSNPSILLASGGVFAGVMAGWNNVKSFFRYISSYVVVQVTIPERWLSRTSLSYLKRHYKQPPSGLFVFLSRRLFIKSKKRDLQIPFRASPKSTIFYRKWQILFVSYESKNLKIHALRWLFKPEVFINKVHDAYEARDENNTFINNYHIVERIGYQGSVQLNGLDSRQNNKGNLRDSGANTEDSPSSNEYDLDIFEDRNIRYPVSEYLIDVKHTDPFEGLYYDQKILDCIEQTKLWLSMREWYEERKIPHRRGLLFYSREGATGKSSAARGIAQTLGIPIYVYHLATMSDAEFISFWGEMETPCMALFEDFDTIFHKRENVTSNKSLTFECILNRISGISTMSGVLLVVTTNKIELIDEALGVACDKGTLSSRPGRIDMVIEFGMISEENKYKMAYSILRDWPEEVEDVVRDSGVVTPMQFNELCVQVAYERLAKQHKRPILEIAA